MTMTHPIFHLTVATRWRWETTWLTFPRLCYKSMEGKFNQNKMQKHAKTIYVWRKNTGILIWCFFESEKNKPGWWFGTWLLFFPSYWEFHHPNWRSPSFFRRGRSTTNQIIYIYTLWLFNIAMENGPFIDDFTINTSIYKGFSMAMLNNSGTPAFQNGHWNSLCALRWPCHHPARATAKSRDVEGLVGRIKFGDPDFFWEIICRYRFRYWFR